MLKKDYVFENVFPCLRSPKDDDLCVLPFEDLQVYFRVPAEDKDDHVTACLKNNWLVEYEVNKDELFEIAKSNLENQLRFDDIGSIIPVPGDDSLFKVLTNKSTYFGAGAWLLLDKLVDYDCFVLPSSVHEVLILPKRDCFDIKDLSDMVRSINETLVNSYMQLSNHAYEFTA